MTNNYIITVDEYGQPYIAHATKQTRKPAFGYKSPLFVEKVELPNGKWRYFYTQKSYKAWLENQKSSTKEQKEMADKKKRMRIQNLRKTFTSVAKKLGYKSEEAQGLLNEIRKLEKEYNS